MPEIKTKDVLQGTIKTVDRTAMAGKRMKDAYVQTKKKAEHSVYSSESNTEEYAADQITDATSAIAYEVVHQVDVQGQKIIHGARQKFTQRQAQKAQQPMQDGPQPSPDAPVPNASQPVQNTNIPQAQQPHRGTPDGAVPMKQEAIRSQQITTAKAGLKAKRASRGMVNTVPQINTISSGTNLNTPEKKPIKTVEKSCEIIKQSTKSAGRVTIKAPGKTIKTASSTVKSVEQGGTATVKTAQATFRAAQKTAIESARAAQRIRAAAKVAATTAKALAAATAKAAKAMVAAAQELFTAIAAGGCIAILAIILVVMCFAGMMFASDENDTEILPVSDEVKAYHRPCTALYEVQGCL